MDLFVFKSLPTDLLSSVISRAVQGMPRVINDSELTTGLTKARPVVIPDRMPMTTLNLDLDGGAQTRKDVQKKKTIPVPIKLCMCVFGGGGVGTGTITKLKCWHDGSVTMEREVKTCDAVFLRVSAILDGPIIKHRAQRQLCHVTNRGRQSARQQHCVFLLNIKCRDLNVQSRS